MPVPTRVDPLKAASEDLRTLRELMPTLELDDIRKILTDDSYKQTFTRGLNHMHDEEKRSRILAVINRLQVVFKACILHRRNLFQTELHRLLQYGISILFIYSCILMLFFVLAVVWEILVFLMS